MLIMLTKDENTDTYNDENTHRSTIQRLNSANARYNSVQNLKSCHLHVMTTSARELTHAHTSLATEENSMVRRWHQTANIYTFEHIYFYDCHLAWNDIDDHT